MNKKRNQYLSWFTILIVFTIMFPAIVFPQDQNKKIKELELKIIQLEQRIEKLEAIILESQRLQAKPIVSSPNKWKDRANWRLLRKGMSKTEVERILGEPPKVDVGSYFEHWYYPDALGGDVRFNSNGEVDSWVED